MASHALKQAMDKNGDTAQSVQEQWRLPTFNAISSLFFVQLLRIIKFLSNLEYDNTQNAVKNSYHEV